MNPIPQIQVEAPSSDEPKSLQPYEAPTVTVLSSIPTTAGSNQTNVAESTGGFLS